MAWESSRRLEKLPADWRQRVAYVKQRDQGRCQWRGCTARGTDVDHIDRFGGDGYENLQLLCRTHHGKKSAAEGHAAKAELKKLLKHPGDGEPDYGRIDPALAKPRANKGF